MIELGGKKLSSNTKENTINLATYASPSLSSTQMHDDNLVHGLASKRRLSKANKFRPLSADRARLLAVNRYNAARAAEEAVANGNSVQPLLNDIRRELTLVRKQQEALRAESIHTMQQKHQTSEENVHIADANVETMANRIMNSMNSSNNSLNMRPASSGSNHAPSATSSALLRSNLPLRPHSNFMHKRTVDPVTSLLSGSGFHGQKLSQIGIYDPEIFDQMNRYGRKAKRIMNKGPPKQQRQAHLPPRPQQRMPPRTAWHIFRGELGPDRLLKSILHIKQDSSRDAAYAKHVRFSTALTNDEPMVNPFAGIPGHTSLVTLQKEVAVKETQDGKETVPHVSSNEEESSEITSVSSYDGSAAATSTAVEKHTAASSDSTEKIDTGYEIIIPSNENSVGAEAGVSSGIGVAALSSLESPALHALIGTTIPQGHDETTIQALVEAGIFSGIGSTDDYTMSNNFTADSSTMYPSGMATASGESVDGDGMTAASYLSAASSSSTISGHSNSIVASRLHNALRSAQSNDECD